MVEALRLPAILLLAITLSACSQKQQAQQKAAELEPQKTVSLQAASGDLLGDALRLYRTGKFEDAASKYEDALQQEPKSAEAYAGLTRCYLKEGKVQEAYEVAIHGTKVAQDSREAHVVLGEVYFRQGRMHDGEQEFLSVVNSATPEPRAYLGLARVSAAISMYARAKQMLEKAHELDSNDPEIEWRWLNTLRRPARIQALEAYLANAGKENADLLEDYKVYLESLKQEEKLPARECKLVATPKTVETYLWPMFIGPSYISGYGLDLKINGHQSRLLLDTGVSGILLNPGAAARAGIIPTMQSKIMGIGDKGETELYIGYADSIKIGALEFKNCPVQVSAKQATYHDGMVGTDLFAHYLVTVDFPGRELKLTQLPKRPDDPANDGPAGSEEASSAVDDSDPEDRYVAPEMEESYTTVFRFGHMLLVPTVVNDAAPKLFLIDTGADHIYISPQAAREVTKVHPDKDTHVVGINGPVINVFRADKATISFGRYKQENQDLISFDYSKLSQDAGTEISGTLGFSLLRMLKIKIDYRDGLVDFNYDFTRVH
ncbi:MAG TPA: aspartyl protease family protein [Terriglobales bacterium]|nr:aspartyl protease family protein [Terriglobales bacterium]